MVTLVPSVSNVATARLSDSRRFCSSGSKSRCELPSSTLPTRPTAPDLNRSCSPSVVLPAPAWPARTTLRRWGRSTLLVVMSDAILVQQGCRMGARTGPFERPPEGSGHSSPVYSRPMSGHSKWSTIKRQKGANDAKRGAVFTKVAREIGIAARAGGGDPDANYRLRLAMDKARSVNMPADNIKRAIEKATGGGEAEQFEEIVYEGYGPGGVAILVEAATDNRNRTAAEVRAIFTKAGGQLAGSGAVAWQFEPRGLITIPAR